MRIAVISTGSPRFDRPPTLGGIQHQIWGMADAYARKGHEVHLIHRGDPNASTEGRLFHDVPVRVRLGNEVVSRLSFSRSAAAQARKLNPDIVEVHERFSAVFPSRLPCRKAFFANNADAMRYYAGFSRSRTLVNWGFFPLKNFVEEECMRRADVVFALNSRDKAYLEGRGFGRVLRTRYGVDLDSYTSGQDREYALFAGRLDDVKGIRVLERAYERIAPQTGLGLHLAGDGPLREQVESWRAKSGLAHRISMLGWLDASRLREEYAHCSVLVLPSMYETFGRVVLEAMASGKAVVASNTPGPADIVEPRITGFLCSPGDSDELASTVQLLADNPTLRADLGRAGRRLVEERYTYDSLASEHLATYRALVDGHLT